MNILSTWLQSSQDPTQVANKVKGVILFLSSTIILLVGVFFHIQLSANDILTLATEIGAVAGAIWTIYGSILHLVTWFGKLRAGASAVVPGTDPSLQ